MFVRLEGFFKLLAEFFPGKPTWNLKDIPDQTGKVIIVTGGNNGIGFETAKALLAKNATVYIASRSTEKGNSAVTELKTAPGNNNAHFLQVDLADLPSIQRAFAEFQNKENKLHVLIDNAGVLGPPMDMLTAQGYDLQFGTNVLGHYLFSKLLIPLMESTAAILPTSQPVRIVEVSSDGHNLSSGTGARIINYNTLRGGAERNRSNSVELYSQSKSGNVLVAKARARLLQGKNIISMSVNPGHILTDLSRHRSKAEMVMARALSYPTIWGAITPAYAATFADTTGFNGSYFSAWARQKPPRSDHVNNVEAEDKLIAWLEEQLRINHAA